MLFGRTIKDGVQFWANMSHVVLTNNMRRHEGEETNFIFHPFFRHAHQVQGFWDSEIRKATRNLRLEQLDLLNLLINKLVRDVVDVERDILNSTEFTGERFFPLTDTEKLSLTTSQMINMFFTRQRWDQISTSLGCFYDYMEGANSTFYGSVVKAVSKDVYTDGVDSLEMLLDSPDLVPGTVAVGQAMLDNVR